MTTDAEREEFPSCESREVRTRWYGGLFDIRLGGYRHEFLGETVHMLKVLCSCNGYEDTGGYHHAPDCPNRYQQLPIVTVTPCAECDKLREENARLKFAWDRQLKEENERLHAALSAAKSKAEELERKAFEAGWLEGVNDGINAPMTDKCEMRWKAYKKATP